MILAEHILKDSHAGGEAEGGEDEHDHPEVPEALDHDRVVLVGPENQFIIHFSKQQHSYLYQWPSHLSEYATKTGIKAVKLQIIRVGKKSLMKPGRTQVSGIDESQKSKFESRKRNLKF